MEMDLCKLITYEKMKDVNVMKKYCGDFYRNVAEDEAYAELAELASSNHEYRGKGGALNVPSGIIAMSMLADFIFYELGPGRLIKRLGDDE